MDEKEPMFNEGDKVILSPPFGNETVEKVIRVTATRAYIRDHWWFNRSTGREPGKESAWRTSYIYPATAEKIAAVDNRNHKYKLVDYLNNYKWQSLSIAQLERIVSITKENEVRS